MRILKGGICHFVMCQIRCFNTKMTIKTCLKLQACITSRLFWLNVSSPDDLFVYMLTHDGGGGGVTVITAYQLTRGIEPMLV